MTFDMQAARKIAETCNSKDESIDHDYWNAHAGMMLPIALAEIERLRDREQQLLLDVDRNYREKTGYAEIVRTQTKHIAELEEQLASAAHAWEVTEERKAALKVAVGDMDLAENIHYVPVLRTMLEEVTK